MSSFNIRQRTTVTSTAGPSLHEDGGSVAQAPLSLSQGFSQLDEQRWRANEEFKKFDNDSIGRHQGNRSLSKSNRSLQRLLLRYFVIIAVILVLWTSYTRYSHYLDYIDNFYHLHHQQRNISQVNYTEGAKVDQITPVPVYLTEVLQLIRDHPATEDNGRGFSQMGLQARIYSHLLKDKTISQEFLDDIEQDFWFWVPGIDMIRETAMQEKAHGRGIILSVNGPRFTYACQFLATLRKVYKSTLPVEIYHYGEVDLPTAMREHLEEQYDVVTEDLEKSDLFDEKFVKLNGGGWAIKAFALLASTFSEVLMADADSVLLAHPDSFFEQKGYKETGTLFFRDRIIDWKSERGHDFILTQLGLRKPSQTLSQSVYWKEQLFHHQESGVLVVDKSRPEVLAALLFVSWQNAEPIRTKTTYSIFWGDKESFWLSFELAGFPYYMVNHPAGIIGAEHAEHAEGFCADHPLHFFDDQDGSGMVDPADKNRLLGLPAWFNGSLRKNKYHDKTELLDVHDSIWAMDGEWEWNAKGVTLCLNNYTRQSLEQFGLDILLGKLVFEGGKAGKLSEAIQ